MSKELPTHPTVVMLVGLPCSGKSTEVKYLQDVFNAVVLSTDNYIEEKAKRLKTTYNKIFESTIGEATKAMEQALQEAVAARQGIVWDQTNLTPASRKKKLDKLPDFYYPIAYVFNEDLETILKRNVERGKSGKLIPHDTMMRMKKDYKVPTKEEGFREIIFKHVQRGA